MTDGGGQVRAAHVPVVGAKRVLTFLQRLVRLRGPPAAVEPPLLNGLPALVAVYAADAKDPMMPPRAVVRGELGEDGRITQVHSVLTDRKLAGLRLPSPV